MKSKYKSSKSVAKNQTVPINIDDPRLAWDKIGQTKARQGAEIDIIGLDGKSLISGGTTLNNPTNGKTIDNNKKLPPTIIPPINGNPIAVYPGQGPVVITPTNPTDVTASWSGEDLVIQFNWDYSNQLNKTISQFIVELTADGVTKRTPLNTFVPNKTQTAQSVTLTKAMNVQMFGILRTTLTAICVLTADPLNNISETVCATSIPTYVLDLPTPTITVTAINNGYSVAYTTPTQTSFNSIEIVEYESTSSTEPTGVTYSRTYLGTINPANIISSNLNARWVKARFTSDGGNYTAYSTAYKVTPTSSVSLDNTPPNEVSQIQASWSGDNIIIQYKLPAQDAGSRIQIELTAPNSLVGYFYRFPDGSGRDQTTIITKKDLFDQFGAHYSSFTGILRSIDSVDNRTSGVSFTVDQRVNSMAAVIPTFTLTPVTNGYSVFANNYASTTGVSYMEVYAKHTPWSGDPIDDTYVVHSGGNPTVIIDTDYTTVYVKIHYYDDFGNASLYSAEDTVTPMSPGEITSFETPISFGANGVIYAGGDYASGKRTLFKSSGIFAYDASSTNGSTGLTTQIVSDASSGTPTFITTRAQIADWNITDTKIENDLSGTPTKYTGLSATGTYAFWAGSDTSGGDSSAKFTVTPSGAVTARDLYIIGTGDANSTLISAGGLFTVKHDGTFTATGADIQGKITADSGEFTGNVKINGGSLYSPKTSGIPSSSNAGVIFNGSGIAAFNGTGGYAEMLTTALADGSVFSTTAANIGGWKVDSSRIYKTSITGKGNIEIDSSNGYISVSHASISDYKAGINSPGNDITNNVFWAGNYGPTSTSNPFRVTLEGKLFATGAKITGGSVESSGALGVITIDGDHDVISLQPADKTATAFLFPRNGNVFLTSGNPFIGGDYNNIGTPSTGTTGIASQPYFAAGTGFIDRYGTTVDGIGIYTGAYTGSGTKPFISATTTGIQIKASSNVSFNAEPLTGTNPGITLITSGSTSAASISLTNSGSGGTITILANSARTRVVSSLSEYTGGSSASDGFDSAYHGASKITVTESNGVRLSGSPFIGDMNINSTYQAYVGLSADYKKYFDLFYPNGKADPARGNGYANIPGLGPLPRSRAIVEDPTTGEMKLGFAIYYQDTSIDDQAPTGTSGYVGDLWVQY